MIRIDEFLTPPNETDIQDVWIFMSVDDIGNKGIVVSTLTNLGTTPLMTGSAPLLEKMKPIAQELTARTGIPVQLYRFRRDAAPLWETDK